MSPPSLTPFGGGVFFTLFDPATGSRLWRSDGTEAGTAPVDFPSGTGFAADRPVEAGGSLYTVASGGLWRFDSPTAAPVLVRPVGSDTGLSGLDELTASGGALYFVADDPYIGRELWRSDGTPEGTVVIRHTGPGYVGSRPRNLTDVNGTLFFVAQSPEFGVELFKSDGTEAGTVVVRDITPGFFGNTPIGEMSNVGGTLFFVASAELGGTELWASDGTAAGTRLVKNIYPGVEWSSPQQLADFNGTLLFSALTPATGRELWRSDGTEAGTVLVEDINRDTWTGGVGRLTDVNGTLYFRANVSRGGNGELWKSDGTAAGTALVKDIAADRWGSDPSLFTNFNGTLYFVADDVLARGQILWRTDGTEAGTVEVRDLGGWNQTKNLVVAGGRLFFTAASEQGVELWATDGTAAGTRLVEDIDPTGDGSASSSPEHLTAVGGVVYFAATDPVAGRELWRSDGTPEGTYLVKDINAGPGGSSPADLFDAGGTLYFRAGRELWKSDGTAAGTVLVKTFNPLWEATPYNFAFAGGTLYFRADDGVAGLELWRSDGTPEGTVLVEDINPGPDGSGVGAMVVLGGKVYFPTIDGRAGWELWATDGTADGTALVRDINPGPDGSSPGGLVAAYGRLYFAATDGATGHELWATDGTADGTVRVSDINPGPGSSVFSWLTPFGGGLYFPAFRPDIGTELWLYDFPPEPAADAYATAEGSALTVAGPGVLGNDADPQGDGMAAVLVSGPAHGTLTLNADGSFTYTPAGDYHGPDGFTYRATDGRDASAPAAVTIVVTPVNDAPAAGNDSYATAEDSPLTVAARGVLGNDTDPDGDALSVVSFTAPVRGTLVLNPDGSFGYVPGPDFNGTDGFTYTVSDGKGGTATGTVSITVTPVNDPPAAAPDSYTTAEDTPLTVALPGVLGNDADPDGPGGLVAALATGPAHGTVTLNPDGSFTYTPAVNFSGTDTFTYLAGDGAASGTPVTVTLVVTPVDDAPLLGSREFGVGAGAGGGVRFFGPDGSERSAGPAFAGVGVRTAAADFTRDGVAELVVGTGPGARARVRVLDGVTQAELFAVDPFEGFAGGVYVAAGDLDGDGVPELVVTPDEGGGPRVQVYTGAGWAKAADFYGIDDPAFRGGARAALGDLTGDGRADLVVAAGAGGGPRISIYDGAALAGGAFVRPVGDFFLFEPELRNGAFVAVGDLDGDGRADLIGGGGPGGGPRVLAASGRTLLADGAGAAVAAPLANFFAGNVANRGGVRVAVKDLDGDARADLVVGDGAGAGSRVTGYRGRDFAGGEAPAAFGFDAFPGLADGVFVG